MEWQPIETAPKDATVLVWSAGDCTVAQSDGRGGFLALADGMPAFHGDGSSAVWVHPTHWQPLPAPPHGE